MSEIHATRPLSEKDKVLREKFYEDIAHQSERVDSLSAHLLSLELAIPGIYATVLKLIYGGDVALGHPAALYWTFGFWFLALGLTLAALTPKKWNVDENILRQEESQDTKILSLGEYFRESARYKRRLALTSAFFFFAGILCAAFTM